MTEPEKTAHLLNSNLYLSLATADENGTPWISTLFFAHDKEMHLFWYSRAITRHSQNVLKRSQVAINIYNTATKDSDVDGLFIEAKVHEVTATKELLHGMKVYATKCLKNKFMTRQSLKIFMNNPKDFLLDSPFRLYCAVPTVIHKYVPLENWKDKFVDGRITVDVREVTKFL